MTSRGPVSISGRTFLHGVRWLVLVKIGAIGAILYFTA